MKNSDKRIDFIAGYLAAYENKIKLKNKLGLYDCAKLFELFALEVSKLYFCQPFHNCNDENPQFPYIDLLSENGEIFVQVTTEKDLPNKINGTLCKIRDSEKDFAKGIKKLYFIALDNDSIDKVHDYIGDNRIGNVDFKKDKNLITTKDMLAKAMSDLSFQGELYKLLKKEEDFLNDTSRIEHEIEASKKVRVAKIIDTIGGKYHLDISNYIEEIEKENAKNVLIEGKAGSGKSVLCKKLCENKKFILYARAERFLEETSLDGIWHFDLIKALEFLENEEIVFFIDALENVADSRTKIELLEELYECCSKYNNVRIIASCRSSDKTAFLGLITSYQISCHLINDIDKKELLKIAKVFPVIQSALSIDRYEKILAIPFYLNLLTRFKSLSDINDENEFRELIWKESICLNDPSLEAVITSMVIDRAKHFLVGVDVSNYNQKVVEKLLSNSVIMKIGDSIRMNYDIFEDICFERFIDKCFVGCRGDYNIFFSELNELGECVYRRYQIWIDDKLLSKANREKFIFHLLFSKKLPKEWRDQTIIGLIKSKHGALFFLDYGQSIIDNDLLNEFIDKTNLYGFEVNLYFKKENYTLLKPVGSGREYLIELLWNSNLYKSINANTNSYLKLCTDYSLCKSKNTDIAKKASEILCDFVDSYIKNYLSDESLFDNAYERIKNALKSIYIFCPITNERLKAFFERMKTMYLSTNRREQMVAEGVFENLFNLSSISFAISNLSYYLSLFEFYYTVERPRDDLFHHYRLEREGRNSLWGFNENAESYEHKFVNTEVISSSPFFIIFTANLSEGLIWLTCFCNQIVENLNKKVVLEKSKVVFHDSGTAMEYYGCEAMWLASTVEYQVPLIVSDLIYSFKIALKQQLKETKDGLEKVAFAKKVRDYIYENTNNVMLLGVVSEIGQYFFTDLHGYAIDLASNIDFVMADYSRQVFEMANPEKNKLTSNMESAMGMPGLWAKRYKTMNSKSSLCDYFVRCWAYYYDELSEKCRKIIKHLYSEVPNNKANAQKYLQIQKMDFDASKKYLLNNENIVISPVVSGEAQKVVDAQNEINKDITDASQKVESYNKMLTNGTYSTDDLKSFLAFLLSLENKNISVFMTENAIGVLSLLLERKDLDDASRENYINVFVRYGYEVMEGTLIFDKTEIFTILFNQLNQDIKETSKQIIKKLMLDLIFYRGQNNIVYSLAMEVSLFLKANLQIAGSFFNTIIELSKDEMNHQIHNAEVIIKSGKEKGFVFKPNLQAHLRGVDIEINSYGGQPYQSKEKEIIDEYLLKGKERDNKTDFVLDNYDVTILCRIFLCSLSLQNEYHFKIAKSILLFLVKMWNLNNYSYSNIIDYVDINFFKWFLKNALVSNYDNAQKVIDLLFNNIDFSLFKNETVEFYCEVFNVLGAHYFDAYDNNDKRSFVENIFKLLEDRITAIDKEYVREELLCIMIFGNPRGRRLSNNWDKLKTSYSYKDKAFLNTYFSKYGYIHLESLFEALRRFHLKNLLPELLISINASFEKALKKGKNYRNRYGKSFDDIIFEHSDFINAIISISFFDYRKDIKEDTELTNAFVGVLKALIDLRYEQAAVFLDEFLIH